MIRDGNIYPTRKREKRGWVKKAFWSKANVSLGCIHPSSTRTPNIEFILVLFLLLHNAFDVMKHVFQCWIVVLCLFFFSILHLIVILASVIILVTLCYTKLITLDCLSQCQTPP